MARQLFSASWHSVALLRPKMAASAVTHRHVYREDVWFVLQDPISGKFHRLSPAAHQFVNRMDGSATVQSIWDAMCVTRIARYRLRIFCPHKLTTLLKIFMH